VAGKKKTPGGLGIGKTKPKFVGCGVVEGWGGVSLCIKKKGDEDRLWNRGEQWKGKFWLI